MAFFGWIFSGIAGVIARTVTSSLLGSFGDKVLGAIVQIVGKKQDINLAELGASKDVTVEMIRAEIADRQGRRDIIVAGMNHPIWWLAWALFVLPVGLYHATIYLVSTFHLDHVVLRVPPTQEEWGVWIVISIFGAQAGHGIASSIVKRWAK
jgi:hypothetical protein